MNAGQDFMNHALMCGGLLVPLMGWMILIAKYLSIEVDLSLPATCVTRTLDRIIDWRGIPRQLRMDKPLIYFSPISKMGRK